MSDGIVKAYSDPKPELLGVMEASKRGLCYDFFSDACLEAARDVVVNELGLELGPYPIAAETARGQYGYMGVMWMNQMELLEEVEYSMWTDHIFDPSIGKKVHTKDFLNLMWSNLNSVPQFQPLTTRTVDLASTPRCRHRM
jgi:hypothetical protein